MEPTTAYFHKAPRLDYEQDGEYERIATILEESILAVRDAVPYGDVEGYEALTARDAFDTLRTYVEDLGSEFEEYYEDRDDGENTLPWEDFGALCDEADELFEESLEDGDDLDDEEHQTLRTALQGLCDEMIKLLWKYV